MNCAVIFYHKKALGIYQRSWIDKCYKSIKEQSFQEFDVFELDYGGGDNRFFEGIGNSYSHFNVPMKNHIEAMNFLINHCFDSGYDIIFNTNIDDWYSFDRFEKQLKAISRGCDLVSSNFYYANTDNEGKVAIIKKMNMVAYGNIKLQLQNNHNVIAHPCVAMHRRFWDEDLHYNDLIGYEDLDLWQRAISRQKKLHILSDYLLYYRIHDNQITKNHRGI